MRLDDCDWTWLDNIGQYWTQKSNRAAWTQLCCDYHWMLPPTSQRPTSKAARRACDMKNIHPIRFSGCSWMSCTHRRWRVLSNIIKLSNTGHERKVIKSISDHDKSISIHYQIHSNTIHLQLMIASTLFKACCCAASRAWLGEPTSDHVDVDARWLQFMLVVTSE